MTTKPKARRFRLRLGDETSDALATSVAPVRTDTARTAAPAAPPAPTPGPAPRAASGTEAARPSTAAPQPARARDALFDEDEDEAPPPPRRSAAAPAPAPAAASSAPAAAAPAPAPAPAPAAPAPAAPAARAEAGVDGSVDDEDLSGRQLRMAMRVAQRNGIKASSGIEAVRLLRKQGIDPFERSTLLDIVKEEGSKSRELTTTEQPQLPKAYRQALPPAKIDPAGLPQTAAAQRKAEISKIQKTIARRRRRRMLLLAARLGVFVTLPTLIAAWYFYFVATPLYATNSEFVIQQADQGGAGSVGALAGMFGGASTGGNDSTTVQSYLQSRDAMRRLDAEEGFKAYFQRDIIDPLRRLPPDATDEAAYRLYQDMVQVAYDPTEGIIKMEVIAADPETSERFATALVRYAEERVDQLTQRLRENQMRDAQAAVDTAEARMNEAQMRLLDLQERFQMLSSEVEVSLLTQQITNLDTQLNQERLSLSDLRANPRPNSARLEQAERRVATLEVQIAELRGSLTQGSEDGTSVAQLQREQVMAQSDVATRQMLLAQAMQQLEAARIEANRQVRYLSLGVSPVAPDEPAYPRAFEDTALAFLIFAGLYLMISMTAAILREQVTG